jgi:hypothetical protein
MANSQSTRLSLYVLDGELDEAYSLACWRRWQPQVIVVLNPKPGWITQIHEACPGAIIIPRNHRLSEQHSEMHADPEGTGIRHARELHEYRLQVAGGVPAGQVVLIALNEPDANPAHFDGQAVQHIVRYTVARFREHARLGDRGGGPDFGVTWPYYGQWSAYEEIHRAARETNCVVTFHRYWRADLGLDHEWVQWAGEWPPTSWGDVQQIIVEGGDDGLLANRKGGPSGWQDVPGLDEAGYMGQLMTFDGRVRARPNILGACIFGWGKQAPWETYDTAPLGMRLAGYAEVARMAKEPGLPARIAQWQSIVAPAAAEHGLDQRVVNAVIELESGGDARAINRGTLATGLMQVLPAESPAWRGQVVNRPSSQELLDPATNVRWGCSILAAAVRSGAGSMAWGLCYYYGAASGPDSAAGREYLGAFRTAWNRLYPGQVTPLDVVAPAEPLPEHEPDGPAGFLAQKVRWWVEEAARQEEHGELTRCRAIMHSLIRTDIGLMYRLERKLAEG